MEEEPGEQCTVVFALIVKEPISERVEGFDAPPPPPRPVTPTSRFRNNLRKDDSTMFSGFLHG